MSDTTLMQRLRHMAGDCNALAIFREAADALEQQAAQIAEKDAEIARLTAELEALKGDLDPLFKDLADYGDENDRLRADAERYRWLRDNGHDAIGRDRGAGPEWTYGDDLDALIDAALRQEQPAGEGEK